VCRKPRSAIDKSVLVVARASSLSTGDMTRATVFGRSFKLNQILSRINHLAAQLAHPEQSFYFYT
jgi:hypothetical protein